MKSLAIASLLFTCSLASLAGAAPSASFDVDPVGVFAGRYDAAGTFVLARRVALSIGIGDVADDGERSDRDVSLSAPIFLGRALRGFYVEPGIVGHGVWTDGRRDRLLGVYGQVELLAGWSWLLPKGVRISAALGGAQRVIASNSDTAQGSPLSPAGYVRAGFAF